MSLRSAQAQGVQELREARLQRREAQQEPRGLLALGRAPARAQHQRSQVLALLRWLRSHLHASNPYGLSLPHSILTLLAAISSSARDRKRLEDLTTALRPRPFTPKPLQEPRDLHARQARAGAPPLRRRLGVRPESLQQRRPVLKAAGQAEGPALGHAGHLARPSQSRLPGPRRWRP